MTASTSRDADVCVVEVTEPEQLEAFRTLAKTYLSWLGEDLGFQAVDDELDTLPGVYDTSNRGTLLVATCDGKYAGTAALRPLQGKQADGIEKINGIRVDDIAELKRLYVDAPYQRRGIGENLTIECIERARRFGYKAVVCDTLERLRGANALYERIGFKKCLAYSYCPLEGPLHFLFDLSLFKVRCITVFGKPRRLDQVAQALKEIKACLHDINIEVQMERFSSNVVAERMAEPTEGLIEAARGFEEETFAAGISTVSLGAIRSRAVVRDPDFLGRLLTQTSHAFVSVSWGYDEQWGMPEAISLARAAFLIEDLRAGSNFRFGVSFNCDGKYIPFFPASSWNDDDNDDRGLSFSIGLENSAMLSHACRCCDSKSSEPLGEVNEQVKRVFSEALLPIEFACRSIADRLGIDYRGIDTSVAPDLRGNWHDMAKSVSLEDEFQCGTVAKIDAITSALRDVPGITTVGYRGVMLPVLENESLVEASRRNDLTIDKLLLYSTVCGVGIDVVPLAGGETEPEREAAVRRLACIILDVAAISKRQGKPLSVRVLPCIGKVTGEATAFESQYLINGVAM